MIYKFNTSKDSTQTFIEFSADFGDENNPCLYAYSGDFNDEQLCNDHYIHPSEIDNMIKALQEIKDELKGNKSDTFKIISEN